MLLFIKNRLGVKTIFMKYLTTLKWKYLRGKGSYLESVYKGGKKNRTAFKWKFVGKLCNEVFSFKFGKWVMCFFIVEESESGRDRPPWTIMEKQKAVHQSAWEKIQKTVYKRAVRVALFDQNMRVSKDLKNSSKKWLDERQLETYHGNLPPLQTLLGAVALLLLLMTFPFFSTGTKSTLARQILYLSPFTRKQTVMFHSRMDNHPETRLVAEPLPLSHNQKYWRGQIPMDLSILMRNPPEKVMNTSVDAISRNNPPTKMALLYHLNRFSDLLPIILLICNFLRGMPHQQPTKLFTTRSTWKRMGDICQQTRPLRNPNKRMFIISRWHLTWFLILHRSLRSVRILSRMQYVLLLHWLTNWETTIFQLKLSIIPSQEHHHQ